MGAGNTRGVGAVRRSQQTPPSSSPLGFFEERSDALLIRGLGRTGRVCFHGKQGLGHVYVHWAVVTGSKAVIVAHVLDAADDAS